MQNSYLKIDGKHPLTAGLEDAGRIVNGVYRVHVKPNGAPSATPLLVIPSYPDLPMESVWVRNTATDGPAVFAREVGKGRVVYFPWDIDRTFWEVLSTDHFRLLANAVAWAANEAPPVKVEGKGVFDLSIWTQKNSMTVHLVSLNNPMTMKGPIREVIPSPPQTVSVKLPAGKKLAKVQLLVAGKTVTPRRSGEVITVEVPPIGVNEVIAFDFAG